MVAYLHVVVMCMTKLKNGHNLDIACNEGVGASGVIIWAELYFWEPSRDSGRRAALRCMVWMSSKSFTTMCYVWAKENILYAAHNEIILIYIQIKVFIL